MQNIFTTLQKRARSTGQKMLSGDGGIYMDYPVNFQNQFQKKIKKGLRSLWNYFYRICQMVIHRLAKKLRLQLLGACISVD